VGRGKQKETDSKGGVGTIDSNELYAARELAEKEKKKRGGDRH